MKNFVTHIAATAVFFIGMHSFSFAADIIPSDAITIEQAYAGSTWEKQKNGAAFMNISNNTEKDIRLVSGTSNIAESVELHTHEMEGDLMMMRRVEDFEIKAGTTLQLNPMGGHIMLMSLKKPMTEGESFDLTLSFDNGSEKTLSIDILKAGMKPENHDKNGSHDHDHHNMNHSDHKNTATADPMDLEAEDDIEHHNHHDDHIDH